MEYRVLSAGELETIRDEFISRGSDLPDPTNSFIMGAFSGPALVGFACAQVQIHMEPFCSSDPHCFIGLEHAIEKEILSRVGEVPVFLVAQDRVAELAKRFKFKPVSILKKVLCHSSSHS